MSKVSERKPSRRSLSSAAGVRSNGIGSKYLERRGLQDRKQRRTGTVKGLNGQGHDIHSPTTCRRPRYLDTTGLLVGSSALVERLAAADALFVSW
jgi:hypothetical protein